MAIINKPTLGTPKKAWQYYSHHMTASLLIREFFDAGYYVAAIDSWESSSGAFLKIAAERRGTNTQLLATVADHNTRAKSFKNDDHHELNSHCFINMWSAFEAGLDNILASYILNDELLQLKVESLLNTKILAKDLDYDTCLAFAARLQMKLKRNLSFASRMAELFDFIDLPLELEENPLLNEAHAMRNIILHRYGEVRKQDADKFPTLEPWVGKVRPIRKELLSMYFSAMNEFLMAIFNSIASSRYVND
ncbi:hypothetical protein [Pseudomonas sp. RC10]|uniref:hypothetical protein n=1 Tax=Pseudomonas bambusae TaxID=3139142 RepID=UPI0031389D2A